MFLKTKYLKKFFTQFDFRDKVVDINISFWHPKLPSECDCDSELARLKKINNHLDCTIFIFWWLQRSQMFLDSNKRVANIIANKELIQTGQEIFLFLLKKLENI